MDLYLYYFIFKIACCQTRKIEHAGRDGSVVNFA